MYCTKCQLKWTTSQTTLSDVLYPAVAFDIVNGIPTELAVYSGTPFERPPWWEATPSGKATWQCKSKHKCIDFYPWREATLLKGHFSDAKGVASQEGFHCRWSCEASRVKGGKITCYSVVWYNEIKHYVLNLHTRIWLHWLKCVVYICTMYKNLGPNCPVKIKAHMKWHPIALLCKQTHPIPFGPGLHHSAIYCKFMYYLLLIKFNCFLQWLSIFMVISSTPFAAEVDSVTFTRLSDTIYVMITMTINDSYLYSRLRAVSSCVKHL